MRLVVFGAGAAAILIAATVVRLHDAPYIAFAEGRYRAAMSGLQDRADNGDRFAAFLVAQTYEQGALGMRDGDMASDWYLKAARMGEMQSISRYINLRIARSQADNHCDQALMILDEAGRSGDLGSLVTLGGYYLSGVCTDADPVMAARYYLGAAQLDRQFNDQADAIKEKLDPDAARNLQPMPEQFDAQSKDVLTQFLAEFGPAARTGR